MQRCRHWHSRTAIAIAEMQCTKRVAPIPRSPVITLVVSGCLCLMLAVRNSLLEGFSFNFDAAGKLFPDFPAARDAIPAKVCAFFSKENTCWKVGLAFVKAPGFLLRDRHSLLEVFWVGWSQQHLWCFPWLHLVLWDLCFFFCVLLSFAGCCLSLHKFFLVLCWFALPEKNTTSKNILEHWTDQVQQINHRVVKVYGR